MFKIKLFSIIFIVTLLVHGQGYKHFTLENGLPSNHIYRIIQDKKGFIWIATDKGVSKFDGKNFVNFTTQNGLPNNDIWNLIYSDNKIWYFTKAKALGYIKNDSVYKFYSENKKDVFYPILTFGKPVTFRSYNKIFKFDKNLWKNIYNFPKKKDTTSQEYYVNHPEIKLLQIIPPDKIILLDKKKNIIKSFQAPVSENRYFSQINDSLLVILRVKNLYILNLKNKKLYEIEEYRQMDHSKFYNFYSTPKEIQISSQNFYAELNSNYKLKNIKKFPKEFNPSNIFKDKKGNYWISSYNKGVFMFPKNIFDTKFHLVGKKIKFLKKSITNEILAGVLDEGVYIYNKKSEEFELLYPKKEYIYDIFFIDRNNYVIFGKDTTLVKKEGQVIPYYFAGRKAIFFNNKYYTTTTSGLFEFDSELNFIKKHSIPDPNVITVYNNKLIIGSLSGLFEIINDTIKKINFHNTDQDLPITCLTPFQNQLLIGTDGFGVFVWDGKNNLKNISETKDLIVTDILAENDKIWLGTQNGILGFQYLNNKFNFWQTLRKFDGLTSDQVINIEMNNEQMIVASNNGISTFNVFKTPSLPIENLYFKEKKYGNDIITSQKNKFRFGKNKNLKIQFGTIDFSGQEHNQYFYKLEPIQTQWETSQSKTVDFNNLSPQNYKFYIKVSNPYGQIITRNFNFSILPLWWQTNLAKFLFALLTLSAFVFTAVYIRKKELKKQRIKLLAQKERVEFELYALRSQMNPHFVFNSLNAIQYYINDGNYDKSETYLVKFARLIRMIFDFSRYKTVKLSQEIKLLKSYLEIEKMRFGDDFNFCIEIDNNLPIDTIEIPTMLLQPIVENAVNHGIFHKQGKGNICMQFKKIDNQTFEVIISDDGVGIQKSKEIQQNSLKKHQSKSTEILKKRIELLNLSGKWKITYQFEDLTTTNHKYSTRVSLKIKRL